MGIHRRKKNHSRRDFPAYQGYVRRYLRRDLRRDY
jgi:hypothetical protein